MKGDRAIHIRWLGAYDRKRAPSPQQGLNAAALHEVADRESLRSWAAMPAEFVPRTVGGSYVGLLVASDSRVVRLYEDDGWTLIRGQSVVRKSDRGGDSRRVRRARLRYVETIWGLYDEVVGVPNYVGVVVHPLAPKRVREMAKRMARLVGLPYLGSYTKLTPRQLRKLGAL